MVKVQSGTQGHALAAQDPENAGVSLDGGGRTALIDKNQGRGWPRLVAASSDITLWTSLVCTCAFRAPFYFFGITYSPEHFLPYNHFFLPTFNHLPLRNASAELDPLT
jgi:hypothetical protein